MRVLVVDDEVSLTVAIKRSLAVEGFDVQVAHDGAAGLELARSGEFDAIVLDVMLPRLNGYEVCRTLRAAGVRTPIIMLTAKAGQWDIVDGLDLGADGYLTKPFSMPVLLAHVRARTRGVGSAGDVVVLGDLRLDPGARRCTRDGVEVELTGRETTLLRELLRRAGEVVSKGDLLRSTWGPSFAGDPNVVEVYVGRLRRKLDGPFDTKTIETVRGVGYRLRDPGAGPSR